MDKKCKCETENMSTPVKNLDPCIFQLSKRLKNVTVEILECPVCGKISIGWYTQENTEDVTDD